MFHLEINIDIIYLGVGLNSLELSVFSVVGETILLNKVHLYTLTGNEYYKYWSEKKLKWNVLMQKKHI